jgi:SnoaL-like domain
MMSGSCSLTASRDGIVDHMTENLERFVGDYVAAWASREPGVMATMCHRDGVLHHPVLSRDIAGDIVPQNNDNTKAVIPDFEWRLRSWASTAETLFLEWTCHGKIGGQAMSWSGVDVMIVQDGKIREETVYLDTYPLRRALDPSLPDEALVDAEQLAPG